jgi:arylsulfate sulfotransferase
MLQHAIPGWMARSTFLLLTTLLSNLIFPGVPGASAAGLESTLLLAPNLPSAQPVGTTVIWSATAEASSSTRYQYRIGLSNQELIVVRDFHPSPTFAWTPIEEGIYVVQVVVHHGLDDILWTQEQSFTITSLLSGDTPVVSSTAHPLVLLYSAPPCSQGSLRVRFRATTMLVWRYTPWQPCRPDTSINQYVAGLLAETTYVLQYEQTHAGSTVRGPQLQHRTGSISVTSLVTNSQNIFDGRTSLRDEFVLYATNNPTPWRNYAFAVDLWGRVVWYYRFAHTDNPVFPWQLGSYLARPLPGGTMFFFFNDGQKLDQILREIDLAGHTVRETNVEAVNRQLQALGHGSIGMFHHDAIRLANGMTVVLGTVERILNDSQGPGAVNVFSDMVIALDRSFRVVWAWNAFDHLDHTRKAVMDDKYIFPKACPPLCLDKEANDWTHTNTIHYVPADGSILLSMRNQSWVIKIDFRDGQGSGEILWRLGREGDFTILADDPDPWFSYQHDVHFEGDQLVLFDNRNLRCLQTSDNCNSRGQALRLDESSRTAVLELSADVGSFSIAFGSAQRLSNGNYHFLSGSILPELVGQSVEVTPEGAITYSQSIVIPAYRSYRMRTLYEPATIGQARSIQVDLFDSDHQMYLPAILGAP